MNLHTFDEAELMPPTWVTDSASTYYLFNPAIVRFQDQILMSYRVVTADGRRRLAICRLDAAMQVVPGSVVPLSDSIVDGGDWHADARFCSFRNRLYLHYNDGYRKPNHIYLVEVDPVSLTACTPARELLLEGPRRLIEKNWMLFAQDDALWAIYSIAPHVVLKLTLEEAGPVRCRRVYEHKWDVTSYVRRYGELRGGAPPVRVGDHYVSFFHSSFLAHPWRRCFFRLLHKAPTNLFHYVGGLYGFAAEPPFTPLWLRPTPLFMPPRLARRHPQLNSSVEYSVFPCGAILEKQDWIVSFGVLNEYCCLATLAADTVAENLANRSLAS